jgi:ATP sulfurylase
LGLNTLADNVILSINRAAEDAAQEAKPIFIAAIKQMTIADATNILLGRDQDAATDYFKRVTSQQLHDKFKPVIQASLSKVGATRYWGDMVTRYNRIPLVTKVNPDLQEYVTQKAIEGLFIEIAKEELKIRDNISARGTNLLQKVFGYADRNRNSGRL